MSYNWQSASTPQGRERLKELLDRGIKVIALEKKGRKHGPSSFIVTHDKAGKTYWLFGFVKYKKWEDFPTNNILFLDPEPQPQPDENGLLPCPFCGNSLAIVKSSRGLTVRCYAPKCVFNPQVNTFFESETEVIGAANRRAGKGAGV